MHARRSCRGSCKEYQMKSAAEAIARCSWTEVGSARSRRLSTRRNSRGKRQRSIGCATGPICARARSAVGIASASPIAMTICPTPGPSASMFDGELYSSIRISVLTSEWRMSPSAEMFGDVLHPRLDRGKVIIDPTRFVADPDKAKQFPELPYLTVRLGYVACESFQCRYRACASFVPSTRRSIAGCSCTRPWPSRDCFRA